MSSPQARRQPTQPSQGQALPLPLRSFTGLWVFLAVLGLAFVALGARGLAAPKGQGEGGAAAASGPTKQQVRERQEHIALTERALELVRKERKAEAPAVTAPSAAPAATGSSAAAAPADSAREPQARARPAPAAAAAPATTDAPAAPAAAKPAAATGLDEMRADIASAFE